MTKYHIALSFAGEDREYVEEVAKLLREKGVEVFYDRFEEAVLWGKDLYEYLTNLYKNSAMFTVMFVSKAYTKKLWTTQERKAAQARAFSQSREYILPAYFDQDVEVPGVLPTTGFISLSDKSPEDLVGIILEKLLEYGIEFQPKFKYSATATADIDFPLGDETDFNKVIKQFKSYTWSTQKRGMAAMHSLEWDALAPDKLFVLGRNVYQSACGGEYGAMAFLDNLRQELAKLPEMAATHFLNGMFFEVYFDSKGEFRKEGLKQEYLGALFELQSLDKYFASINFAREALEPYRHLLLVVPNPKPETLVMRMELQLGSPPLVASIICMGKELLREGDIDEVPGEHIWRLSVRSFNIETMISALAQDWGVPISQISVEDRDSLDEEMLFRIPEGKWIASPIIRL